MLRMILDFEKVDERKKGKRHWRSTIRYEVRHPLVVMYKIIEMVFMIREKSDTILNSYQ